MPQRDRLMSTSILLFLHRKNENKIHAIATLRIKNKRIKYGITISSGTRYALYFYGLSWSNLNASLAYTIAYNGKLVGMIMFYLFQTCLIPIHFPRKGKS